MPLYPINIRRCQHIKVNGTQCASPALRDKKHCYYHIQSRRKSADVNLADVNLNVPQPATMTLPTLEDANSIQVGLAEVIRLLATKQIEHRAAGLMLYALQTASVNIRHTTLEPLLPTRVVIDQECVESRPIGATAWSNEDGCEYDDLVEISEADEKDSALKRLIDLLRNKPDSLEMKIVKDENGQVFLDS